MCVFASVHVCVNSRAVPVLPPSLSQVRTTPWSFYPKQIPENVGNFSQTLLVTVPWLHLLPPPSTPTSLTDTAQRADTWLYTHTETHSDTHPRTSGKVKDQQKHSRETGEDRRDQMQHSTQQGRKGRRIVVTLGDKK